MIVYYCYIHMMMIMLVKCVSVCVYRLYYKKEGAELVTCDMVSLFRVGTALHDKNALAPAFSCG